MDGIGEFGFPAESSPKFSIQSTGQIIKNEMSDNKGISDERGTVNNTEYAMDNYPVHLQTSEFEENPIFYPSNNDKTLLEYSMSKDCSPVDDHSLYERNKTNYSILPQPTVNSGSVGNTINCHLNKDTNSTEYEITENCMPAGDIRTDVYPGYESTYSRSILETISSQLAADLHKVKESDLNIPAPAICTMTSQGEDLRPTLFGRSRYEEANLTVNNLGTSSLEQVTIEDARKGLHLVILYLEAHPDIGSNFIQVLWNIMEVISGKQPSSNNDQAEDDNNSDITRRKDDKFQEDDYTEDCEELEDSKSVTDEIISNSSLDSLNRPSRKVTRTKNNSKLNTNWNALNLAKKRQKKTCPVCFKVYTNMKCYSKHLNSHKTKVEDSQGSLDESVEKGINTDDECFSCSVCNKDFNSRDKLRRHHIVHTGLRPFQCNHCDKRYSDRSNFRRHHRSHTGERPYQCTECGKCFAQTNNLKQHMRIHTGEKPFQCQLCEKCFAQPGSLKTHMSVHNGLRPHICSTCGMSFAQLGHLQSHMLVHTGEKKYKCDVCGKRLGSSKALKDHNRIHLGIKQYKCKECDKPFTTSAGLRTHIQTHTGERPYLCPQCGKGFSQSDKVARHMRIHTGERPFACDICGQAFSDTSILRRHKMVHTKKSASAVNS